MTDQLPLDRYRNYLRVLAKARWDGRLAGKIDASDLVQLTLLKAHQSREQFRGSHPGELAAWLRQILARTVADAARDLNRDKRDAGRERSLDAAFDETSCRLEAWLAAEQSSPSVRAQRAETVLELADALAELPEEQRDALLMKHCDGLPVAEIAARMNRTVPSVAGLLRRGLEQLRDRLGGGAA